MRILFAGTPQFAVVSLQALLRAAVHEVVGVYTQPDRPAGRGRAPRPVAVKQCALAHGLPVEQPETLRDPQTLARLRAFRADLLVTAAYGLILPAEALTAPRLGCVNVHASLLPRWRGAAPIQRALLAGDAESGITILRMDERLDAGEMLERRATPIHADDNAATLHDRLARLGAEALLAVVDRLGRGELRGQRQDERLACYAQKIDKREAQLDWRRPAVDLLRQINAFNPAPVAWSLWRESADRTPQRMRIWRARLLEGEEGATGGAAPGVAFRRAAAGIDVATGAGALRLLGLQLPGRRAASAADLLNGRPALRDREFRFDAAE